MLPNSFFDWWFAPWRYAVEPTDRLPLQGDFLGRQDGYRLWCKDARVPAGLPARFDPAWHIAMGESGPELTAAARLFGGLFAARAHDQSALGELEFPERKWCVGIAATQPLRTWASKSGGTGDSVEVRGLAELAGRLESGFPGVWPRLRLTLPAMLRGAVDERLADITAPAENASAAQARAQRCWMLCRNRAKSATENAAF